MAQSVERLSALSRSSRSGGSGGRLRVVQVLPALHGGGVERGTLEVAQRWWRRGTNPQCFRAAADWWRRCSRMAASVIGRWQAQTSQRRSRHRRRGRHRGRNRRTAAVPARGGDAASSQPRPGAAVHCRAETAWRLRRRSRAPARHPRRARTTRANLALVYGDRDDAWRRRLARESLRHTAMTMAEAAAAVELAAAASGRPGREARGDELLRQRPPGRGALVLAPHYGNWEFLGYYLNTIAPWRPSTSGLGRRCWTGRSSERVPALATARRRAPWAGFGSWFGRCAAAAWRRCCRTRCPSRHRDPDPAVSAAAMNRAAEDAVATQSSTSGSTSATASRAAPNIYR